VCPVVNLLRNLQCNHRVNHQVPRRCSLVLNLQQCLVDSLLVYQVLNRVHSLLVFQVVNQVRCRVHCPQDSLLVHLVVNLVLVRRCNRQHSRRVNLLVNQVRNLLRYRVRSRLRNLLVCQAVSHRLHLRNPQVNPQVSPVVNLPCSRLVFPAGNQHQHLPAPRQRPVPSGDTMSPQRRTVRATTV
jgi:hypothetical protein